MWTWTKRILLFAGVNIAIMITLQLVFALIMSFMGGSSQDLYGNRGYAGGNLNSTILIYYSVIGMGGALINLMISKQIAKWSMGVRILDAQSGSTAERNLVMKVHSLAQRAGLPGMPEVGVYDSPEVNAFATGPSKGNSLVAVSTGLLQHMDDAAVEGVLGHEVAHIANGDMVTMTLIQGVMNTMVLIVARVVAGLVANNVEERSRPMVHFAVYMLLQIVLSLLGSLMVAYFSRRREFRADRGGAQYAGRERMLAGLKQLRSVYGVVDDSHQELATLKISGHASSFMQLFSTHPPLEERIRRLETMPL